MILKIINKNAIPTLIISIINIKGKPGKGKL